MKTKFKDYLLYSLACVGAVSLFISATTQPQQTTSTVPESHIWEMHSASTASRSHVFAINKKTGEVKQFNAHHEIKEYMTADEITGEYFGKYKLTTSQN